MGYIDRYTRGAPSYSVGEGPLDIYKFIQDGYDTGAKAAKTQRLNQLASQAYGQTGDDRSATVQQAIGIDPQKGYDIADVGTKMDAQAQALKQQKLTQIGKAAQFILQAKQQGNAAAAQGAYQAIVPLLQSFDPSTPLPPTLDESHMPNIYKIAALAGATLPQPEKGVVISAGGNLVNPQTGQPMYSAPFKPQFDSATGTMVNPQTGTFTPVTQAPTMGNGMGMGQAGAAPAASAAPQVGTPVADTSSLGLPPGASASQATGPDGTRVLFTFAPGTPDAVKSQMGAAAGVAQPQETLADYKASHGGGDKLIAERQAQINALKARGVQMTPEDEQQYLLTGKASNFQGQSTATAFGDTSLKGPQYVQSIPEGNREIVKGLLNGTVALPSGTALKNPLWQSALASVKHADPAWNQGAYKQYTDTRKYFTIGQGGQLINSINTASQHLDKLREDIAALHNGDFTDINSIRNTISTHTGGQGVTNFDADLTPVASELAAVYKGKGVPSDAEIAHFRDSLKPNMSYGQQMNVIRGWIDLLAGKLNATREQYRGSMSKLSDPLSVINPHAAEALERITSLANDVSTTGRHALPQADTTPINAPGGTQPASIDALLQKYGGQ